MDNLVFDLKIQLQKDRVPEHIMSVLMKGKGKFTLEELIIAANKANLKVTVYIEEEEQAAVRKEREEHV
jgi:hypothetical protein